MEPKLFENSPIASVLEEPDIQEFIRNREILTEDFVILEKLAKFPQKLFIEFHNFFNLLKDRSIRQLENDIVNQKNIDKKKFMELLLNVTKKYDYFVSNNLVRVFEKRKIKKQN